MRCGVCGGGVRGFRGVLHGRPIADWKHTDVPPGTAPHRPVLGTPVDAETLARIHRREVEVVEKEPRPQITGRCPIGLGDLEDYQSVQALLKQLESEQWAVLEHELLERSDGVEYLHLSVRRRDLGALVIWRFDRRKASWMFDEAWALSPRGLRQVQSKSLKEWLHTRDEECPDCGRSSVVHDEGECP